MDISLILTIIGLGATFIFGFLSIDLFKRKKYPGKLTFVKQSSVGLFDSFVKNFPQISILFENKPIKDNLIYIKGSLINDGNIDIEGNRIEKPISIKLPDKYSWINCQITDKSQNLTSHISFENNKNLALNFGLFRKGEFIQIEGLIEASHDILNDDDIFDSIKFDHRISQTQKVSKTNLLSEDQLKKKKVKISQRVWHSTVQMFIPFVLITIVFLFANSEEIKYKTIENNINSEYRATAKRNGKVELTNLKTSSKKVITISEFQDKDKYIPFVPEKNLVQTLKSNLFLIPFFLIMLLISIFSDYWQVKKNLKIYQILKNKE